MSNLTLKKRCRLLVIAGSLLVIPIKPILAANIYISNQELRTKTLQLQQEAINTINSLPNISETDIASAIQNPAQVNISIFPIVTTLITPGTVTPRALTVNAHILQPIFLIGSDNLSQQWLKQNVDKLKQLHAMGFLIQAQDETEADNMKALADNLTLAPMPGDSFAQNWQLDHYPVLISSQGITQ